MVRRKYRGGNIVKKLMLLAALLAMVVVAAIPAMAQQNGLNHIWRDHNNFPFNDNSGVSQDNEQDAHSGASSQGIIIEGPGDNSNQCIGLQGISNTGNALNQTGVLQYASKGDVGVDDSGNLTISPSQSTTCDQKVNQAASASGQ
jgi:hypothetical protein